MIIINNMLILIVPIKSLHIGIIFQYFPAVIFQFTSVFSDLCLFVGSRDIESQNKMDIRDLFRSICLTTMLQTNTFWFVLNNIMLLNKIFKFECW